MFTKSGMTELTWRSSGITSIKQLKGKKVGVWCCGNENELYAALVKNGMDPHKDVTIVNQPFDMTLFLSHKVDAAAAMTYNELAQVLESKDPKTGKLYQLSDLNIIRMQNAGTAMLEGRHLLDRQLAEGLGPPGHRQALPDGELPGLDLLP